MTMPVEDVLAVVVEDLLDGADLDLIRAEDRPCRARRPCKWTALPSSIIAALRLLRLGRRRLRRRALLPRSRR
jgi:hypothetical protein